MIESETGSYVGYGFAVPITLAEQVKNDLIKYGTVRRAIIGVGISEVTPEDAQAAGLKTIGGAKVGSYSPNPDDANSSPAGRAGLKPGDIIIAAAGKSVDKVSTLQRIIRGFAPGQTVDVEVMRFGQDKTFSITLGEQPADVASAATPSRRNGRGDSDPTLKPDASKSFDRLGLTVAPATAEGDLFQSAGEAAPPAAFSGGLAITDVSQRGPSFDKVNPTSIITKELYPTARNITSAADLTKALAEVKAGGVISFMLAVPSSGTAWTTTPVSLRAL